MEQANELRFRRVLLKLSGEALMGTRSSGIDPVVLAALTDEIVYVHSLGVELALVVGGGNIFRGSTGTEEGIDRGTGDHMGMLATLINSLALRTPSKNAISSPVSCRRWKLTRSRNR